jgi:putative thioredoxin
MLSLLRSRSRSIATSSPLATVSHAWFHPSNHFSCGQKSFFSAVPPSPPSNNDSIVEVTKETFQSIIQGSSTTPTIIDCYADWCGPCKTLTPLLEQAVQAANGSVILAKINTDEQPELAQALNVTSLPSVYGIFNGEAVDTFVGVPTPEAFDLFMEKMTGLGATGAEAGAAGAGAGAGAGSTNGVPQNAEQDIAQASHVLHEMNDSVTAATMYQAVLERDDVDTDSLNAAISICGLLSCAIKSGNQEAIAGLIERLTDAKHPHSVHIENQTNHLSTVVAEGKLLLSMEEKFNTIQDSNGNVSTMEDLEIAVKEDPKNIEAFYSMAVQHLSAGELIECIDAALRVVRLDKTWQDAAGKVLLLEVFEMLGNDSAVVKDARRRMTNLLL